MRLVTRDDIVTAHKVITSISTGRGVIRTPLLPIAGQEPAFWVKPECLQPIGAFKIRGALHAAAVLPEEIRRRGLVTYSSGNHARALAYAAWLFGVSATVIVPRTAPATKVQAARALGAEIVEVAVAEREAVAHKIAEQRGARLIPPFDDPDVIAGQGTVGLEIAEDLPVDVVLVPISGGGLISGVAAAVKALRPEAKVIGVEPELAADTLEGFRAGHRADWPVELRTRTAADGLTAQPSELTFAHIAKLVDDIVTVSETEILDTVGFLARECRLVAEPSGAVATAAYLNRTLPAGKTVAVVSGGNIDPATLSALISRQAD